MWRVSQSQTASPATPGRSHRKLGTNAATSTATRQRCELVALPEASNMQGKHEILRHLQEASGLLPTPAPGKNKREGVGVRIGQPKPFCRRATRCACITWRRNLAPVTRTRVTKERRECSKSTATALRLQEVRGLRLSKDQLRETYFDGTILNFRPGPPAAHWQLCCLCSCAYFRGEYHARTMTVRAMIGKGLSSAGSSVGEDH